MKWVSHQPAPGKQVSSDTQIYALVVMVVRHGSDPVGWRAWRRVSPQPRRRVWNAMVHSIETHYSDGLACTTVTISGIGGLIFSGIGTITV